MKGEIQMETTLHFAQNADAGTEEWLTQHGNLSIIL